MAINAPKEKVRGIGWNGRTLTEMLEDSERLFKETGRYYGLEKLELKEKDPIRYERIFSRIRGGLVNARETALNISASPIVKEIGELCFALYTPEGDSVALSTGIIVHVHTMSDAIKYMIRNNYEFNPKIRPGDVFGNNDAIIGDVHNADVHTLIPIFYEGELLGWAGGVTHEIDVGATYPGSMSYGQANRFPGDGFIVPCEKIGENDELYKSYELRAQMSVRMPMYWLLDEKTRLAGCQMIRDAVIRLVEEEGVDVYKQFIREVIEEGRRSFLTRVKEMLIPGTYEAPAFIEVPFKDEPVNPLMRKDTMNHAPLELTIGADGEYVLSFEGANKWGYHSFNCAPSPMQGALWVLLTQTLISNDKVNDGAYLATKCILPYGSWCNPDYKNVSTTLSWSFLIPSFTGMIRSLSRAFYSRGYVEEVLAGYPVTGNLMQGGGINQFGMESAFTNFEISSQGTGAGAVKDGEGFCAAMWNPEGDMGDIEAWEYIEPLLYLGRQVKPDTAGHGKYRGGPGMESLRMVWKTKQQNIYNAGDGYTVTGGGLFGGYPGSSGYRHNMYGTNMQELIKNKLPYPTRDGDPEDSEMEKLVKAEKVEFDMKAMTFMREYGEWDLYLSVQRGGPGLGDPLERELSAVEKDLNEGLLSPRFVESVYGAVAVRGDDGKWKVDVKASEERRQAIRQERKKRGVPVKEWMKKERERILKQDIIEPVKDMYNSSMELSETWAKKFRDFWNLPEEFKFQI